MAGGGFDIVGENEKGEVAPATLSDHIAAQPLPPSPALPAIDPASIPPEENDAPPLPDSPDKPLSPRHRRAAELIALGHPTDKIAAALGYTTVRINQLRKDPRLAAEIQRISDRIYEETIGAGLKRMVQPALDHLNYVLTTRDNKVRVSEKNDIAKWLIEKIDGKAAQKVDLGGSLLTQVLDKLDAIKSAGKTTLGEALAVAIDVSPKEETQQVTSDPMDELPHQIAARIRSDEEQLDDWVSENPLD